MKRGVFFDQTALLLRILSVIGKEPSFAIKGGTAINLFLRNMPRLSIDIDLTWVLVESRNKSLEMISTALGQIAKAIRTKIPDTQVQESRAGKSRIITKLFVKRKDAQIKIEPNTVIRGTIYPVQTLGLCAKARELFELDVTVSSVSTAELYGGKICAALDRQHPRDLFDIKLLLDGEGLTEEIRKAFVVHLASHDRPMHELIDPVRKDIKADYENEFLDMLDKPVTLKELIKAREDLIKLLKSEMSDKEKRFLLSLKAGNPEWALMGIPDLDKLPAVQWKLHNIKAMADKKQKEQFELLRIKLGYPNIDFL